ncbi:hypothetical protein QPK87_24305 [Kamptonema cortianum]|nr:hypothetical protein [Kamptonema cortianum]
MQERYRTVRSSGDNDLTHVCRVSQRLNTGGMPKEREDQVRRKGRQIPSKGRYKLADTAGARVNVATVKCDMWRTGTREHRDNHLIQIGLSEFWGTPPYPEPGEIGADHPYGSNDTPA